MYSLRPSLFAISAILLSSYSLTQAELFKKPTVGLKTPTFAKDVAPILYSKCAPCHHAGEVAPFTLTSYEDAHAKAATIAAAMKSRFMPPWQAISHGEFKNERTLTADEIKVLQDWAKAGAPKGDLKVAPKPPTYTPGWSIGTPDLIAKPPLAYTVEPEGNDEYRCFVIPTHYPEGRYVTDVEVRPGNRNVVHHILVYVDTSGVARRKDGNDGMPGYASFGGPGFVPAGSLGGWAPGLQAQSLPKGSGMWLPKGADIVIQVHYHRDGKREKDFSQIGIKFAKEPIDKKIRWESLDNEFIDIPAGESRHEVKAEIDLKADVTLLDVIPHMHLLGHDMTVTATLPDGAKKELIHVEPYDFNWQTRYTYKQPVHLPKGTHVSLVAHYDNSATNSHNPNRPPKRVTFGEQTTDEMCFAFFSYTFDSEHMAQGIGASKGDSMEASGVEAMADRVFDRFDANHDGYLDPAEMTEAIKWFQSVTEAPSGKNDDPATNAKMAVSFFGKEKKGFLSKAEFKKLIRNVR